MLRRRSPTIRRLSVLLSAVAAVLGLSGCFTVSHDVKVRADGTGTVVLHAEVDKRAVERLGASVGVSGAVAGEPPFKLVDQTFPDGTKVRTTDDAQRSVFDASFAFNGPDDYQRRMAQVSRAISIDDPVPSDGSIQVKRVGERMEVGLDLGGLSEAFAESQLLDLTRELPLDDQPRATVTLTMPGAILTTNGTPSGRTATWDLLRGAPARLTASSEIAEPGLPRWALPAAVGLVVVLVLAIVGILLSRRSRGDGAAVVPARPEYAPPGASPGTFFPPTPGLPPREPVAAAPQPPDPLVWAPQPGSPSPPPPPPSAPAAEADVPAWVPPAREDDGSGPAPAAAALDDPAPAELGAGPEARGAAGLDEPTLDGPGPAAPTPATPARAAAEEAPPRFSIWGPRSAATAPDPAPSPAEVPRLWRVSPEEAPRAAAGEPTTEPAPTGPADATTTPAWEAGEAGGDAGPREATAADGTGRPHPDGAGAATSPVPEATGATAPAATGPVAGWYADPAGGGGVRYWDGTAWTRHTG